MGETRRKFDQDFREGAVRLVRETGKPIVQVARELGIVPGTLENWAVAVGALPVAAAVLLAGFADPRRPECGLVVEPGEVPRLRSVVCLAGWPCRHVFMVRSGQIRRRRGGWRAGFPPLS
jgi:Transposase